MYTYNTMFFKKWTWKHEENEENFYKYYFLFVIAYSLGKMCLTYLIRPFFKILNSFIILTKPNLFFDIRLYEKFTYHKLTPV